MSDRKARVKLQLDLRGHDGLPINMRGVMASGETATDYDASANLKEAW